MVIDQLNNPKKLNQYANKFVTAIRYRQIEVNALFSPVIPVLFLFIITTDIENTSAIISITDKIPGIIFSPFHFEKCVIQ